MKILSIDDDKSFLDLLFYIFNKKIFPDGNFSFVGVQTFSSARQQLLNSKFDVILIDIYMPKGDGIRFLKEIRESELLKDQYCVLLSGISTEGDRIGGEFLDANLQLDKSGTLQELEKQIRRCPMFNKRERATSISVK